MVHKDLLKYHSISLQNTFFIVCFTILPLIFGILYNILFTKFNGLSSYYMKGEFFLYSVSLISSTYIGYNSIRSNKNSFDGWINKILLMVLVIISACYSFIISNSTPPRPEVVEYLSYGGFIIAVPLFYYSQFLVNKRSPDISDFRKNEQVNIQDKLN